MTRDTRYLFLTVLLFFFAAAFGQAENRDVELKKLITELEKQHHVKFNYLEEDVAGLKILPPENRLPLKVKLNYISNRTALNFKQVGIYVAVFATPAKEQRYGCAFITDENGNPVDDAVVQVNKKIFLTGPDGYFEFPIETDTLYVEHMAYQTVKRARRKNSTDCEEIRLTPAVKLLSEIITERYLAKGIARKKDGTYNIKPTEFGILPGLTEADVLQAMQQLPGINSADETVSNINVRGGTHDQNLFTWNGIRLFQTGHFFGLISAINPNLAHDIRISKNGTSAFYGESVSSAVDISSRTEQIGNTHAAIGSNMIATDGLAHVKTGENADIEVSARRSFTDVLDFPTYTKYSERIFQNTQIENIDNGNTINNESDKEFYFYDFTAQYHQKIGFRHHLYADIIGIKNKLDFTQSAFMPYGLSVRTSNLRQETYGGSLKWDTNWNARHSSEATVFYSYYDVNALNSALRLARVTMQKNTIYDAGLHITHHYKLNNTIGLHFGYQYSNINIKNTNRVNVPAVNTTEDNTLNTHAAIAEAEYNPAESPWYVKGGLRLNYIPELDMVYAEPRLNLSYKIDSYWQLQLQGERKSQSASQVVALQDDFLGLENRRWTLANGSNIPVQRSSQLGIGINYKGNGWLVTLDNFYKKVNGITTGGQAFRNQFENRWATGNYVVYGSEFLVQKQFRHFYVWLSYAYNHNDYHFSSLDPNTLANNFELPHTVNNAITYEWKNLKIALGSKFFSGRPYTAPLLSIPSQDGQGNPIVVHDYPNGKRLASYFQANFSADYTVPLTKKVSLEAGISVQNLLNRRNIVNRYYRLNETEDGVEVVNIYGLYRTPNALLRLKF